MIRKWSYLNSKQYKTIDFSYTRNKTFKTENKTWLWIIQYNNFKTFRTTTRFKRYNLGITKFNRRNDRKRKHYTNWASLTVILFQWACKYAHLRSCLNSIQSLYYFRFNISSPDFHGFYQSLNKSTSTLDSFKWSYKMSYVSNSQHKTTVFKPNYYVTPFILSTNSIEETYNIPNINYFLFYERLYYGTYNISQQNYNKEILQIDRKSVV